MTNRKRTSLSLVTASEPARRPLPLWRAVLRTVLVAVASVVAAALMVAGITGCADMSGIGPTASLRNAPSLGLKAASTGAKDRVLVDSQWWRDFDDEPLNRLMAQALTSNPSLKLAQARLARAQAVMEVAGAATLPRANGQIDLTRQRYSANGAVPTLLAGAIQESGTGQLNASWELDFSGKNRAALDAALGSANAAQADAQAARALETQAALIRALGGGYIASPSAQASIAKLLL